MQPRNPGLQIHSGYCLKYFWVNYYGFHECGLTYTSLMVLITIGFLIINHLVDRRFYTFGLSYILALLTNFGSLRNVLLLSEFLSKFIAVH
jgi:hypothetical protein